MNLFCVIILQIIVFAARKRYQHLWSKTFFFCLLVMLDSTKNTDCFLFSSSSFLFLFFFFFVVPWISRTTLRTTGKFHPVFSNVPGHIAHLDRSRMDTERKNDIPFNTDCCHYCRFVGMWPLPGTLAPLVRSK